MENLSRSYDFFGSAVLVKFPRKVSAKDKKEFARGIMGKNPFVRTVLEKTGKFKGRLRRQETKFVFGEKTKEILYRENGCVFRFNVDTSYFSPRLSNERKEIASLVKKGDEVLVMFAGVAPFSIVIAKHSAAKKVYSVEINREASKYAEMNVGLNKLKNRVEIIQADVKKFAFELSHHHHPAHPPQQTKNKIKKNFSEIPKKFDIIVMPRPRLKESFLKEAFALSKKGTRIFYYDFCKTDEIEKIKEKIFSEAKKAGKKIKILKTKIAGEVGPYRARVRADFQVL